MISRFAKPYTLTSRANGGYVAGVWVDGAASARVVKLNIQPVTARDAEMLKSLPEGRRTAETRIAYADADEVIALPEAGTGQAGDILLLRGERWMFVSRADFDTLPGRTAHQVFLLQREIEHSTGEQTL